MTKVPEELLGLAFASQAEMETGSETETRLMSPLRVAQAIAALLPNSASQAEMEAGTEAALRLVSPLRVAQAIAALASNGLAQVGSYDFATTPAVGASFPQLNTAKTYMLGLNGLLVQTDGDTLRLRTSTDTGATPTYDSGNNYRYAGFGQEMATSVADDYDGSQNGVSGITLTGGLDASDPVSGFLVLTSLSGSAAFSATGLVTYRRWNTTPKGYQLQFTGGMRQDANAVAAVEIGNGGGNNILGGTLTLWEIG